MRSRVDNSIIKQAHQI